MSYLTLKFVYIYSKKMWEKQKEINWNIFNTKYTQICLKKSNYALINEN